MLDRVWRKRNERNPKWKRRSKTLFADDMIFYIEYPKDSTRIILELINEYSGLISFRNDWFDLPAV